MEKEICPPVGHSIDDDVEDMLEFYGMIDRSNDEMQENGVSWSDFI